MNQYAIWSEGFHVMEGRSGAILHGYAEGETFEDACKNLAEKDSSFKGYFDPERLTYWGCRLFDNEVEARVSFG